MLCPRLRAVADLVEPGLPALDVGTDHAYLPVRLVKEGVCPSAAAVDIRVSPLENARRNVEKSGLSDRIDLWLGDGLSGVEPGRFGTVIIAGMGGELIADIIASSALARDRGTVFVLQPMTRASELRKYLCENGFTITRETAVADSGRDYLCVRAVYTGDTSRSGDLRFYHTGLLESVGNGAARSLLKKEKGIILARLRGLPSGSREAIALTEVYDSI